MTFADSIADPQVLARDLRQAGFRGQIEDDPALRAAMSTDSSVYQIEPALIMAPVDADDMALLVRVLDRPAHRAIGITARGGGTGTNGQSLNRDVLVDTRRHMNRMLRVDLTQGWAEVEPGMVLDDLNDQLRPSGWFFAPETSSSTRCTIGGMVSTDASGKGSRVYGKTSDNILGLEIALPGGLLSSDAPAPDWARDMLERAEAAARGARDAFIARTPRLNRRFTGYDLERACPENHAFEWWRLFLGAECTLGLISRIRVRLTRLQAEKRLLIAGFDSFENALAAATPLLRAEPTAVEVMDERVQALAEDAGILARLPESLQARPGERIAYAFVEFNGNDPQMLAQRIDRARSILTGLAGAGAVHVAADLAEIRELWAIRSAGVGLLGKVDGQARPVAFVEDSVVPPENLPAFIREFFALMAGFGLDFGIYGHVDVGCLHLRPSLNIDLASDRERLVQVSDAVFHLTRRHGGIFWGEHGKGVRGAYLQEWVGDEVYAAFQAIKAAFDPHGRFNPGKLVSIDRPVMGIGTTPFRAFNAPPGDDLTRAFRCNGNAQCLSYARTTPMCPSYKATADLRQSPKGRADALRAWHQTREARLEQGLLDALDGCLGCKACASTCPVQVDIPTMRSAFYEDYFSRHRRPLRDRIVLWAERLSPLVQRIAPLLTPLWPMGVRVAQLGMGTVDMPARLAGRPARQHRLRARDLQSPLPAGTVILVQDWFTALFDADLQSDMIAGFTALGFRPRLLEMRPAGKAALTMGDRPGFREMGRDLAALLDHAAATGVPLIGMDPAFVMQLRQDFPKAGITVPHVQMPQEFLLSQRLPALAAAKPVRVMMHCTEATGSPCAAKDWTSVFTALAIPVETPATGCCGMAGLFGHQRRHQDVSRRLFDLSWRTQMSGDAALAATGYSCRCQSERLAGTTIRHPIGLIAQALGNRATAQ